MQDKKKDKKHKMIYNGLVSILGAENVSDDPSIMHGYSRDFMPGTSIEPSCPTFVAIPGSTKDVQAVIKLANRLKFPYIPVSTNLWSIATAPTKPYTVTIDPKRMDRIIEIDEKNMYAIIEPYVSHAQVHAEAIKRGLYVGLPEAGGQASHLANHCYQAAWGVSHRIGMGYRNILSMEWVLPNGEILTTGSFTKPEAGRFWGEGPGPDLRGLLRGSYGVMGGFGMVTKMAVKLHPYSGPSVFPCEGILPRQRSVMPKDKFEWYFFTYPTKQKLVDAMVEIGHAEIGGNCLTLPLVYLNWWGTSSGEEYWETWKSKYWHKNCKNLVAVCLWGFTSSKQVEYEKKVLEDIIEETGGNKIPQEEYDRINTTIANSWIRTTCAPRVLGRSGTALGYCIQMDTFDNIVHGLERSAKIQDKYSPPILDSDHSDWIASYDMGHIGYSEDMYPVEKTKENLIALMEALTKEFQTDLKNKEEYNIAPGLGAAHHMNAGSVFGYDKLLKGIKKSLDPNNTANPPQPIPVD